MKQALALLLLSCVLVAQDKPAAEAPKPAAEAPKPAAEAPKPAAEAPKPAAIETAAESKTKIPPAKSGEEQLEEAFRVVLDERSEQSRLARSAAERKWLLSLFLPDRLVSWAINVFYVILWFCIGCVFLVYLVKQLIKIYGRLFPKNGE